MESIEVSDDNNSGNMESPEVDDDNNPRNIDSTEVNDDNNPGNMESFEVKGDDNPGNTESSEVDDNNLGNVESFEVNDDNLGNMESTEVDDNNPENVESFEVNYDNNPGNIESSDGDDNNPGNIESIEVNDDNNLENMESTANMDKNEGNAEWIKVKLNKRQYKRYGKLPVDLDKKQLRTILLYEYKLGHNAKEASDNINQAFGKGTVSHPVAQLWFKKFRNGDMRLGAEPPPVVDDNKLRDIIEANPQITTQEAANELNVCQATVSRSLKRLGKSKIFGKWVTDLDKPKISPYDRRSADRPPIIDYDQLRSIVEADPRISTRQIADQLNVSQGAVCRHLKEIGMKKMFGRSKTFGTWVTMTNTTETEKPTDSDSTQGWTYH